SRARCTARSRSPECGRALQLLAQMNEPVQPGHAAACKDRCAQSYEDPRACLCRDRGVAAGSRDCPDDCADDDHEDGDDEDDREHRSDDNLQITDAAHAAEVWEYIHDKPLVIAEHPAPVVASGRSAAS